MDLLVDPRGRIRFGLYDEPVGRVNHEDFHLLTPLGRPVSRLRKKFSFHHFVFLGIIDPGFIVGLAVVDLGYLVNGFFYVYNRRTRRLTETSRLGWPGAGVFIDPRPDMVKSRFQSPKLTMEMDAGAFSAKGKDISISGRLDYQATPPLRICTRAGYRGWVYKQSTTPVKLTAELTTAEGEFHLASPASLALIDWSCGHMRRETYWNWTATAWTLPDGRPLGLNLSCGVNETSFTESYFLLDGRLTKLDMVNFEFDPQDLLKPWRITSFDRRMDLCFQAEGRRGENVNALAVKSRFTQLMGLLEGRLTTAEGEEIEIVSCPAWAEDHYALW
ncbi:MAG: DUF2804 domain-containing protein [Thermodesulfobacteriota bacterium]